MAAVAGQFQKMLGANRGPGGRKARSAAPPAADSGGGREASPGPEAGRSASPGCGPPRPSLQARRCGRKLDAGTLSPELARESWLPTLLLAADPAPGGGPPPSEQGGRFVEATPGAQPRGRPHPRV